jgi:hypothetical protein
MSAKFQKRVAEIEAQLPTHTAIGVPGTETHQLGAVSQRKVEANRENARKSTGPRTIEGKANSRRNTIKHGLFARDRMAFLALGENSLEYEKLELRIRRPAYAVLVWTLVALGHVSTDYNRC